MYVVSMCLLGVNCTYAGKNNACQTAIELFKAGKAIAVCPEQLGGLTTPRIPAEIIDGCVINEVGDDVTARFQKGVEEAIRLVQMAGCTRALLKARSPSCGYGTIYDGTFSHTVIKGDGVFARRLREMGISAETEEEV